MDTPRDLPNLDGPWLESLRLRYLEIAARRVPSDAAEDLAQDALGIVLAKGPAQARHAGEQVPPLRWCFQVLRHVIGNWYQKRREQSGPADLDLADTRPDPLAALAAAEKSRFIRAAIAALRLERPDCADWLWALADGKKAGALAAEARIAEAAFYRRIYRCRQRLAEILAHKGVAP